MKLLNELLNLTEVKQGTTLVGLTIYGKLVTDKTKNEVWDGDFNCARYNLESLEGAPKKVNGNFVCPHTITSLEGAPKEVTGYFNCSANPKLESLEGVPKEIGASFGCSENPKLTSLKNIHKQITHLGGKLIAHITPIKSNVLGLLLNGCTGVKLDNKEVEAILNKYLPNTRGNKGLFECQSELLDADLEDYAEL